MVDRQRYGIIAEGLDGPLAGAKMCNTSSNARPATITTKPTEKRHPTQRLPKNREASCWASIHTRETFSSSFLSAYSFLYYTAQTLQFLDAGGPKTEKNKL